MQKSPDAFRTISEVATDLDVPQHVLRFWETRFSNIRPLKRGGGRRYYRPADVDLLKGIRQLLYGRGYTIKGVQRILKEDGLRFVQALGRGEQGVTPAQFARQPELDELPDDEADDRLQGPKGGESGSAMALDAGAPSPLASPHPPLSGLAPEAWRQLRAVMDELVECERILGTLKAEEP